DPVRKARPPLSTAAAAAGGHTPTVGWGMGTCVCRATTRASMTVGHNIMKVVRCYGIRGPPFQSCLHVGGPHARRAAARTPGRVPGERRRTIAGAGRAGGPPGGGG